MFETEDAMGEVLLSVTGEACTVDELLWELLEGGKPRALKRVIAICVVLDMCRCSIGVQSTRMSLPKIHINPF